MPLVLTRRLWIAFSVLLFLVLAIGGGAGYGIGYLLRPDPPTAIVDTTFHAIRTGAFPSGDDKKGTDGVLVRVYDVMVMSLRTPSDGDWWMAASDPSEANFTLEIIPRDQDVLGRPPFNQRIEVIGVPFCDRGHEHQAFHWFNRWEIHPVLSWKLDP